MSRTHYTTPFEDLPRFIKQHIEKPDWMVSQSPYVAFIVRGGTWVGRKRQSGFETSDGVRRYIKDFKARSKCVSCGESDPCCLHFHHRHSDSKLFNLSSAAKYPLSAVKDEIAKCDVLCANCHAKVHAKRIVRLDQWIDQQEDAIV